VRELLTLLVLAIARCESSGGRFCSVPLHDRHCPALWAIPYDCQCGGEALDLAMSNAINRLRARAGEQEEDILW
jgi:hypothetical protein